MSKGELFFWLFIVFMLGWIGCAGTFVILGLVFNCK